MLVNLLLQPDIEESIAIYEANCSIKGSFLFQCGTKNVKTFWLFWSFTETCSRSSSSSSSILDYL